MSEKFSIFRSLNNGAGVYSVWVHILFETVARLPNQTHYQMLNHEKLPQSQKDNVLCFPFVFDTHAERLKVGGVTFNSATFSWRGHIYIIFSHANCVYLLMLYVSEHFDDSRQYI